MGLNDELANIVGERYFSDKDYINVSYARGLDPVLPEIIPKYVLRPDSTEQVSGIIKIANKIHIILNIFMYYFIPKLLLVSGVCLFFRKKSFNKIGGFDVTLHLNEDVDVVKRTRKEGKITLLDEKVYSSDRRLQKMGALKFLSYSIKAFLKYHFRKEYKGEYIKTEEL